MLPDAERIDHFAWIVHPENIEKYVKQLSELFKTQFDFLDGSKAGFVAYVAWNTGLELISPLRDGPGLTGAFYNHLQTRGEGPWGLICGVTDIRQSASHAKSLGWPVGDLLQSPNDTERHASVRSWTTAVTDVKELIVGQFLGLNILFGEITYPPASK
ncbi:MAG: hypothetical protein JWM33_3003 [Caulobacteraceae bacterium]|nr:hypothetical protein [Caulobacteraceae bacterium]